MTDKTENTETNETQPTAKPKKRRWCRILLCVSAVIFLPIFALVIALSTSAGQRNLIELADKYLDNLAIAKVSGSLQEGLVLDKLQITSQGVTTNIEQVHLRMGLNCLLRLHICIQDITVKQPHIQVDTALLPPSKAKKERNQPMQRITLPMSVEVENILIEQAKVQIDENNIDLARFQSAVSLNNETGLTIQPTNIDELLIAMKAKATIEKAEKNQAELAIAQTATDKVKEKVADKVVEKVGEQVEKAIGEEIVHNQADQKAADEKAEKTKSPIDWDKLAEILSQPLLADLPQVELPFDIHLPNIQGNQWQYQHIAEKPENNQIIEISNVQLQADATGDKVQLTTIALESSAGQIHGQGQLQLSGDYPIQLDLQSQLVKQQLGASFTLPKTDAKIQISGNLLKQTALSLQTNGIVNASLTGQVELHEPKTPFQLNLDIKDFKYPWDGLQKKPLTVPAANLALSGNLLNYQMALTAQAEGMDIPKTKLALDATGELTDLTISQLRVDALQGTATVQGKLGWRNGVQWYSDLQLTKLNLSEYVAKLPTVLSGSVFSTGLINQDKWLIDVPDLDLQGSLSNRPLALKGKLSFGAEQGIRDLLVKLPELLITYGDNKINAHGFLGEKSDLKLDINAPNLQGLLPTLMGNIKGQMDISGNLIQPRVSLDLTGKQIKFKELNLYNLQAKGDINIAQGSKGQLDLQLDGLNYSDIKINSAKLAVQGDEKQHQLILTSQGDPVGAKLNINGSFDRTSQNWRGNISQINIQSPVGSWQTNQAVNINYDHKNTIANIHAHCWQNSNIELCFPQNFQAGKSGEVPFNIKKFDLALVNQLTEQNMLKGQLTSEGKIAWFSDKAPQLNVAVNGQNLEFSQKIDRRSFNLDILKLQLNANLNNNNLALTSELNVQDEGKMTAQVDIKDLAKARQLGGAFVIHHLNLDIFNQILPLKDNIGGKVTANIKFGGNLNSPDLNGSFNIQRIRATMAALPFDINDGQLNLNFRGHDSTLQGYIKTADSQLDMTGNASWKTMDKWTSTLHIKADQFKVDIPSIARLRVSPDIYINANPKRLELSGNVDIPWARIAIEELPASAVEVSKDEVILDGKTTNKKLPKLPAKTKSGMEIVSNLTINIGKDVHLDAYGLTSNLNGLLSVRQDKGNLGLYGQINLTNGRYASFGQDLLIRKGLISFSGLPSQPMLNIEAIRNPESMETSGIIAGVKVVGLAESPEVKVFSEPGMSQDQALSYILTGRSLENSGEGGSGGSIGAALLGLGLAKSGKVVGGIGQAFGIQDLNLGTQGVGDASKVVVSGSITPRLQVKYGVGLFDGLAEFTVRYRLLPKLYLQSVSGVTQAVDLLYQFEF